MKFEIPLPVHLVLPAAMLVGQVVRQRLGACVAVAA